mgnify:CR=1 FL=1
MGNRKQPFGYRVVMGEIALHPQESKLVEYIFQQYLAGATYNTLVEELREQSIPYDEGKLWNKNMVARILEDSRYTGERGYPPVIDREALEKALEKAKCKADGSSQNGHAEAPPPLQRAAIDSAHGATGAGSAQQPDHIAGTTPASSNSTA